jgi:DMSO/TMAO reductase YedYZ molybdopterin-dependent catalytic subunit
VKLFPDTPPPGPFREGFWRSPLRGPWLTSLLGSVLLVAITIVALTGLISHSAYQTDLGPNALIPRGEDVPFTTPGWFAGPTWLYALTQGLHVNVGLLAIPLLLAKLWSVIPRLFAWPPVTSPAQVLERLSITLLVSSAVFELMTGVADIQYWYVFPFSFVTAHYYGAIIFIASLVLHVAVKTPVILRAYRERGVLAPLRADLAATRQEPADPHGGLVAAQASEPTISRRGLFALVGAGSAAVLLGNVGTSIGGPMRKVAFLGPRRDLPGTGPNAFPVNKTAKLAGITPDLTGTGYVLTVRGPGREIKLSREDLLRLPQRSERLTIGCVEGWSTTQRWTGVSLPELARRVGAQGAGELFVQSLQAHGGFREVALGRDQLSDERALLALKVNGADLSPDHGYPARIIVPSLPGVHNTKWVGLLEFRA